MERQNQKAADETKLMLHFDLTKILIPTHADRERNKAAAVRSIDAPNITKSIVGHHQSGQKDQGILVDPSLWQILLREAEFGVREFLVN